MFVERRCEGARIWNRLFSVKAHRGHDAIEAESTALAMNEVHELNRAYAAERGGSEIAGLG